MKVLFTLVILLASNVSAVYADIPKRRSKSYRQVEDSQPSTTSFVGGGDEGADFPNQRKLLSIRELGKKKKNGGKNNINRYQGKSSKHDKRAKSKRGKSDKSNKNLFGRSGHTPTPLVPTPFPTNGAVLVWTPDPSYSPFTCPASIPIDPGSVGLNGACCANEDCTPPAFCIFKGTTRTAAAGSCIELAKYLVTVERERTNSISECSNNDECLKTCIEVRDNAGREGAACSIPGEFCALTNTNTPICDCTNTRLTLAGLPGLGSEGGCCYENQDCGSNLECIGQLFFGNGTLIRTPGLNVPRGTCGTEIPEEDDLDLDLGKCRSNNECSIPKEFCALSRGRRNIICRCENNRLTSQGSPGLGTEGECCYENQDCESNLECIGQEINDYGSPNRTPGQDELRGTCAPEDDGDEGRGEIPDEPGFVEEGGECNNAAECIQREGGFGVVCLVKTTGYCYPSETFIEIGSINCSESNACGDTDFPACSDGERCIRQPNVEDCIQQPTAGTCTCTKGCSTRLLEVQTRRLGKGLGTKRDWSVEVDEKDTPH